MSYVQTKEALDNGRAAFHQFKGYLDEKLGEVRTEVEAVKTSSRLDGEDKQIILKLQEEMAEQKKMLNLLQVALNAPGFGQSPAEKKTAESEARKAAFDKRLRLGTINALAPEERKYIVSDMEAGIETKALYTSDATGGGFLTTPEYVDQLLKNIVLISDMASIVDMRTTSKPWIMTPKRTQTASAVRVAEQATRTETQNPRFGLVQNFPYEAYAFTLVSRTDLDDSELDLSSFLMSEFAEQFAKLQGFEFINGLGSASSQAFGFLNDPIINNSGNGTITTTSAGAIDYLSLVKLKASLKPGYRPNATWIWTTETEGAVQALTDTQGRPLWIPFGGTLHVGDEVVLLKSEQATI